MPTLILQLEAFLRQEGWPIHGIVESPFTDEKGLLSAYKGDNDTFRCFGLTFEEDQRIAFYAKCPFTFSIEKTHIISEFFHRINYDMVIGNFEINYDKQEIRFKTSMDIEGTTLNHELLAGIVFPAVMTMDLYLPLIHKIISSAAMPVEVLAELPQLE